VDTAECRDVQQEKGNDMKTTHEMKIRAHREPWARDAISLLITAHSSIGGKTTTSVARPLVFDELSESDAGMRIEPTTAITQDEAQQLMDELWSVGIRPTAGAGSVGQLAATERHVERCVSVVIGTCEIIAS